MEDVFLLAPHDPETQERIEWEGRQLDLLMRNQRPLTLLSAAALAFTVAASDAHWIARVVAAVVLGASVWFGVVAGWTVTAWMHHVGRRDWDGAKLRSEQAREESSLSQALLTAGSCELAAGYVYWLWAIGLAVLGAYGFVKLRERLTITQSTDPQPSR